MMLTSCHLCPRNCGADRANGQTGYCKETACLRVGRAALHHWEEPCISGARGSGAVFFSGCPLGCIYCQNQSLAAGDRGLEISIERLSRIFLELQDRGAHNINLVTPTHYVPQIRDALILAKADGLVIPVVYNTGGYEKVETLKLLEGLVDIYLPDLKYLDPETAGNYSHAPDYPDKARDALQEMFRQVGSPAFDEAGIMTRGMIVRHLVLPGHTAESRRVMEYLFRTYGHNIYISILNQYTPLPDNPGIRNYPELNRTLTEAEYDEVVDYAIELGVENGFIQEGGTAEESFIPCWNGEGVL